MCTPKTIRLRTFIIESFHSTKFTTSALCLTLFWLSTNIQTCYAYATASRLKGVAGAPNSIQNNTTKRGAYSIPSSPHFPKSFRPVGTLNHPRNLLPKSRSLPRAYNSSFRIPSVPLSALHASPPSPSPVLL